MLKEFEDVAADIKYITESKPHRLNFINDFDHAGNVTRSSISEGLTACATEDQKFINKLTRAKQQGVDFLDDLNQKWDVKNAASIRPLNSKYKFKVDQFLETVIDSFKKEENLIIDITDLNQSDLLDLTRKIREINDFENLKILYIHKLDKILSGIVKG